MLIKLKSKIPRPVLLGIIRIGQTFLRFEDNGFPSTDKVIAYNLAIGGPINAERLLEGTRIAAICIYPKWSLPRKGAFCFPTGGRHHAETGPPYANRLSA
jgi:hypothetical protein